MKNRVFLFVVDISNSLPSTFMLFCFEEFFENASCFAFSSYFSGICFSLQKRFSKGWCLFLNVLVRLPFLGEPEFDVLNIDGPIVCDSKGVFQMVQDGNVLGSGAVQYARLPEFPISDMLGLLVKLW